jgi:hypothetical protein
MIIATEAVMSSTCLSVACLSFFICVPITESPFSQLYSQLM